MLVIDNAQFAPWFFKSQKYKLSRFSTTLFESMERDYINSRRGICEGERALAEFNGFIAKVESHEQIEPRQKVIAQKSGSDALESSDDASCLS